MILQSSLPVGFLILLVYCVSSSHIYNRRLCKLLLLQHTHNLAPFETSSILLQTNNNDISRKDLK